MTPTGGPRRTLTDEEIALIAAALEQAIWNTAIGTAATTWPTGGRSRQPD